MNVDVHYRTLPRDGESESGDAVVVRREESRVLLAVIDVLGHGPEAAAVAAMAVELLRETPLAGDIEGLVNALHDRLRGTRGAAALVCLIEEERLSGCGVGNVDLRCIGSRVPVVLTPGVLGGRMRSLRTFEAPVAQGDRLLIFSDGVSSRLEADAVRRLSAEEACEALLSRHRKGHDDATILVADLKDRHAE